MILERLDAIFLPLKHCPDKEGIKTLCLLIKDSDRDSLKHCPDKEGIKTP